MFSVIGNVFRFLEFCLSPLSFRNSSLCPRAFAIRKYALEKISFRTTLLFFFFFLFFISSVVSHLLFPSLVFSHSSSFFSQSSFLCLCMFCLFFSLSSFFPSSYCCFFLLLLFLLFWDARLFLLWWGTTSPLLVFPFGTYPFVWAAVHCRSVCPLSVVERLSGQLSDHLCAQISTFQPNKKRQGQTIKIFPMNG